MRANYGVKEANETDAEQSESIPVKRDRRGSEWRVHRDISRLNHLSSGMLTSRNVQIAPDILKINAPNRLRIHTNPKDDYPVFINCPNWVMPLLYLENQVLNFINSIADLKVMCR